MKKRILLLLIGGIIYIVPALILKDAEMKSKHLSEQKQEEKHNCVQLALTGDCACDELEIQKKEKGSK